MCCARSSTNWTSTNYAWHHKESDNEPKRDFIRRIVMRDQILLDERGTRYARHAG